MPNDTKKIKESYKHLSLKEREIISMGLASKKSFTIIAKEIGRDKSTISRELKKYTKGYSRRKYFPFTAHKKAKSRKRASHKRPRIPNIIIRNYIEEKIKLGWSPEQIAGRLPIDHLNLKTNYESIYLYIYSVRDDLIQYLPKQGKNYRTKRSKGSTIKNRVSIDNRPEYINNRTEIGHWEADTMVSKQSKNVIQVLFERKIKLLKVSKLENRTAKEMSDGIIKQLKKNPDYLIKSITYDNGKENAYHEKTNKSLNTKSYFCNPYHSWEKGGVENSNGLIRRYLPKKTDFALIDYEYIKKIENLLNNRPRKSLDYKTPNEMLKYYNCCT